jgi:hypothetical protein
MLDEVTPRQRIRAKELAPKALSHQHGHPPGRHFSGVRDGPEWPCSVLNPLHAFRAVMLLLRKQEELGWARDRDMVKAMNLAHFGVQYTPEVPAPGGGARVIWEVRARQRQRTRWTCVSECLLRANTF